MNQSADHFSRLEWKILALVFAAQFVNILEFMIVMPLGPDFARELGIPFSQLGWIGGSYTAAATVSGVIGSLFLDRLDRRKSLSVFLLLLAVATCVGARAQSMTALMAARVMAGFFGGPATAISIALIADVVPPSRRGRAMGAVFGAFSVASVVGVPLGLELAAYGTWRMTLWVVAASAALVAIQSWILIPRIELPKVLNHTRSLLSEFFSLFSKPEATFALLALFFAMLGGMLIIPNISAYVQFNLGFPREKLGTLYLAGGICSLIGMQITGFCVDRFGAVKVAWAATAWLCAVLWTGYVLSPPMIPVMVLFAGFMLGMTARGICTNSLSSRVPHADQRARYMSLQSAMTHLGSSGGAFLGSMLLGSSMGVNENHLTGMPFVAGLSITCAALVPLLLIPVERKVRTMEGIAAPLLAE